MSKVTAGVVAPEGAKTGDMWMLPDGECRIANLTWEPATARDRHGSVGANAVKVLPGSVFIAPREPLAGWENLGFIVEDDDLDGPIKPWGSDKLLPRRNILDGGTLTIHDVKLTPETIALLTGDATTTKKESTVIDKKKFENYTYRTNANDLSGRHVGALVKVKTTDGVEITDVLTGVLAGEYVRHQSVAAGEVLVTLKHYKTYHGEQAGVLLDANSPVTVRHAIVEVPA